MSARGSNVSFFVIVPRCGIDLLPREQVPSESGRPRFWVALLLPVHKHTKQILQSRYF